MKNHLTVALRFRQQLSSNDETESYQIEVTAAPGQGWGGPTLPLALNEAQITAIRQQFQAYLERHQQAADPVFDERSLHTLRVTGNLLFEMLPESVRTRLYHAQQLAREGGQPLALVLIFERSAHPLLSLPWELLHDPAGNAFFGLQGGGVTRQLVLPGTPGVAPDFRPQNVLGLWAEPQNVGGLHLRRECGPAPGKSGHIRWVSGAGSLEQLSTALENGSFDGLHIVAHGRAGKNWRDLSIALADEHNRAQWVSPDRLAVFTGGYPGLKFVYLEVCAAGGGKITQPHEPLLAHLPGGLAAGLLAAGIPVVIAMQDNMGQRASGLAAQTFYSSLDKGLSLPEAMTAARRAVRLQQDDPIHWSIPALYMQPKPDESRTLPLRAADWLLNNVQRLLGAGTWLGLAALVWAGFVARMFAAVDLAAVPNWRALALPTLLAELLVFLAAAGMQAGQRAVGERYRLDSRGWLEVLLHKYTSAAVWAWGWWWLSWTGWLGLAWMGLQPGGLLRWALWLVILLGMAASGYAGARQAIRQSRLFLRIGHEQRLARAILLFLAAPFFPLLLVWGLASVWGFLSTSVLGLLLLIGVFLGLAFRQREQ